MKKIIAILSLLFVSGFCALAQSGIWSGILEVQGIKLTVVFNIDENGCTFDSPDQGAKGIKAEASYDAIGQLVINIPSIFANYKGMLIGGKIVGNFSQQGMSFPLTLTPGAPELKRPQTPVGPFPYSSEEVSFTNGNAVLKGTLTLPEGYTKDTPVLLMITGSGLQNRDEEMFGHKPFAVIADAFARNGIATLRYDDRGFGESTGDIIFCTTEDLKKDALSGIELLRKRFGKVGAIGHSEGGTIAIMLASEGKIDFTVSLAGMVISGKETLLWQNKLALAAMGFPEATVDLYCKLLSSSFDARIEGTPAPSSESYDLPNGLKQNYQAVVNQLKSPYMQQFLSLDMRPLLSKISIPVLALNGTKDTQVEYESNLGALRKGLKECKLNSIKAEAGLNHLFQHSKSGLSSEYKEIEETFSPEVITQMISWIQSLAD